MPVPRRKRIVLEIDGVPWETESESSGDDEFVVRPRGGADARVRVLVKGSRPLVLVDGRVLSLGVVRRADGCDVLGAGRVHGVRRLGSRQAGSARGSSTPKSSQPGRVVAPMPGRIVSLQVAPGEPVAEGAPLLVIEAMKMQNQIVSPRAGSVRRVLVASGQSVDRGALLVEIG